MAGPPAAARFNAADVDFIPYVRLPLSRARVVEDYCHTLDPERDNGETPYGCQSTLAWIHAQNFAIPRAAACEPFGTLTAFCRRDGSFLGMASVVLDDRGVRARYSLDGDGMWGGVIVPERIRGRGVGRLLVAELDARCQAYATRTGAPARFLLFTDNPAAERMYNAVGFVFIRVVTVIVECAEGVPGGEDCRLLEKVYEPRPVVERPPARTSRVTLELCMAALRGDSDAAAVCLGGPGMQGDPLDGFFLRVTRVPCAGAGGPTTGEPAFRWLQIDGPEAKPVTFVAGADALRLLIASSVCEPPQHLAFLYELGYETAWIRTKLAQGQLFRAVVWYEGRGAEGGATTAAAEEEGGGYIYPATWEGVAALAVKHFGEAIGARIWAQLPALRSTPFDAIEAAAAVPGGFLGAGGTFFAVNESAVAGASLDTRFMTPSRFAASDGSLAATRGFLYNAMGLSRLYDGSGRTVTGAGRAALAEFLTLNREVALLPGGAQWLDLAVGLEHVGE